jgi:hypothetical protein
LRESWSGKAEELQRSTETVVGHLAESGRDVRVAGSSQGVDNEATEGGHIVRAVSGADLGGVLGELLPRTKWRRFSMTHRERTIFAMPSGETSRLVRSVMT